MGLIGILFVLVSGVGLLTLPRRWAPLALLAGTCYMTQAQGVEIGPFNFPVIRILIAVGFARVLLRGERMQGGLNRLDGMLLLWGLWALAASLFHDDVRATAINRLGMLYSAFGIYFLLRVFCRSEEEVRSLCRITALVLIPLALELAYERATGRNLYAVLGGVSAYSAVRGGEIRAQGPFGHAILAGTVGAVCLPLMAILWRRQPMVALAGACACLLIVAASASSGPILSTAAACAGLALWPWRRRMRALRWLAVLAYLGLELVMNAPAYFVLARLDVTGSSTAWHRAELIRTAILHLSEWWLAGTDYTRHWMAYGVAWSGNHIDITNYYIRMGVDGGLPLMLLFIGVLAKGFSLVGDRVRGAGEQDDASSRFVAWALGAMLFAHAASFIAVSYFDQTVVFLYLTLAAIGAMRLQPQPVNVPAHAAPPAPGYDPAPVYSREMGSATGGGA